MKVILEALKSVMYSPIYFLLTLVISFLTLIFVILLPNFGLISQVFGDMSIPIDLKLNLVKGLLGGITTNFSVFSAAYTVIISLFFGINITFVLFLLKKRISLNRKVFATGFGGTFAGVIGIGCAACGTFILSSILSVIGASGALALLPLNGGEFGLISIGLLVVSIYLISKTIVQPAVCEIK
ncbi:MAG: hypothetical protein V4519_03255 [Patescibacteria group bacterium]